MTSLEERTVLVLRGIIRRMQAGMLDRGRRYVEIQVDAADAEVLGALAERLKRDITIARHPNYSPGQAPPPRPYRCSSCYETQWLLRPGETPCLNCGSANGLDGNWQELPTDQASGPEGAAASSS